MNFEDTSCADKQAVLARLRAEYPGTTGKGQQARLLAALRLFPITTYEASRGLDVYHPPARVLALRKAGHSIHTLKVEVTTEAGVQHRIGKYILVRGGSHV